MQASPRTLVKTFLVSELAALGCIKVYFPLRIFAMAAGCACILPAAFLYWDVTTGRPTRVYKEIAGVIRPVRGSIVKAARYIKRISPVGTKLSLIMSSAFYYDRCHHILGCSCDMTDRKDLEAKLAASNTDNQNVQGKLNLVTEDNARLRQALDDHESQRLGSRSSSGRTADWWERRSGGSPGLSPNTSTSDQDQSYIESLRKALTDSNLEKQAQQTKYDLRIRNLKAQLTYAAGEGNATLAKEEVESLQSQLRVKQRELNLATRNAAQAMQSLEFEKESRSSSCKCQGRYSMTIQRLEGEKQLLLEQHAANDIMVQQAAREFGKSEADAKHYTLRTYLQEITQAMVQQIAAGGLGNVKNQPIFNNILNNMDKTRIKELEAYKNRLEDEVHRLGGNVQIMRLGLDPKLPQSFRDLTYEAFAPKAFSIYTNVCLAAKTLTDLYIGENVYLTPWQHDPPRNDASNQRTVLCGDLLDHRPIVAKNPKFDQYEILVQALVHEEITRIACRVLVLGQISKSYPVQDTAFYRDSVGEPLKISRNMARHAFRYLDDIRVLEKRYNNIEDAVLAARAERRFRIWRAMQEAIEWLAKAIISFNSSVPEWREDKSKPPPSFAPPALQMRCEGRPQLRALVAGAQPCATSGRARTYHRGRGQGAPRLVPS